MGVYTHSEGNWLSRRGSFLVLLAAFHVVLLWALKSGFAIKVIESITKPIEVQKIEEVKPDEPPPPPPPVKAVELPPVSVPPLLVDIRVPSPPPPIQVTNVPPPPGPPAPPVFGPPAPPAPPAVVTKYALTYKPDTEEYYPSASRSAEEEGRPIVKICFDTKGKVIDSTLETSSGKPRLDAAAVRMSKQFRYKPGTSNGQPIAQCIPTAIKFTLNGD
jgi:protein TonB